MRKGADAQMLAAVERRAKEHDAVVVSLCAKMESEILELPAEERASYYDAAGISSPGLARLAAAGRELLGLICFFTAGEKETRAWLVSKGDQGPAGGGEDPFRYRARIYPGGNLQIR